MLLVSFLWLSKARPTHTHTHTHCSQICPITYNHVCLVGTSIVPTTESLSYRFITPTIQLHYHLGATNLLDKLNRTKPVATAASLSFYIILHSVDSGYTPTYHEPTRSLQIQGQHLINPTKHQSSPRSHVAKSHGNRILASKWQGCLKILDKQNPTCVVKKHNISGSRSKEHVWREMFCLLPKTWSQLVQAYSTKKAWVCVMLWPWRLNPMGLRHQPIGWYSCHNKIIQLSTYATSIGVLSQKHQQIGCSEGLSEICPWHTFDSWWGEFPNLRNVQVSLLEANG